MTFSKRTRVNSFINHLASTPLQSNATNMYSFVKEKNAIRRENLKLYLLQMLTRSPEILLVGEAPGYQGARHTGVSFCSEYILLNGVSELGMFGKERGYEKTDEYEKVWKEPSATIVWGTLAKCKTIPLIWASFPFHPHKSDNPLSNRAPTREEVYLGQPLLQELIGIFGIKTVVAVGNVAYGTLTQLGYAPQKIRHPSHGGKEAFAKGVMELVG